MSHEKRNKKRVIVAMSSGVDSSVAAALLKKQGYDVVGVFMHFWKEPSQNSLVENKCCSLEAQEDARKVCQILGIPLYTANVAREFKKEVVDYYLAECQVGRTPNPCVACNKHIKFQVLLKKMLEMKADYIASGHYACIKQEITNNKTCLPAGRSQVTNKSKNQKPKTKNYQYRLFESKDKEKDQSYFLFNLNQKQLAKILFPIGKFQKPAIRKMAEKMKLPVFDKDDSQGICFAPEKYPTDFLKRNLRMKTGEIVDTVGKVIGKHEGLPLYTVGQRRGINIGGTGPYYVVAKDIAKNILIVTNKENEASLYRQEMQVEGVNWLVIEPKLPAKIKVKIRYRHPAVDAIIKKNTKHKTQKDKVYDVIFKEAQRAVTSGQAAVFYSNKGEVLGGGTII